MVATLLNSARAVEASQFIVEAFVEMQANPKRGSTLRDETEELIDKGLANLKSRLAKAGLENEEIEARNLKFLAEAEERPFLAAMRTSMQLAYAHQWAALREVAA